MKNITLLLFGIATLVLSTSANRQEQQKKRNFEKIVFTELTVEQDSMLFQPYSKAWKELWQWPSDVTYNGTQLMNYEKYTSSFNDRKDNLWTIVHPLMINGSIQVYYPYDPNAYGMGAWDDGEMRFPMMDESRSETFLTSEEVRENICSVVGQFGPESDVPLTDEYGDPVIVTMPDGTQYFKYPPRDYYWFDDKTIKKYKLRVRIELNKKGKEKKRVIEAIAPVRYRFEDTGKMIGEEEIVWFDFKELKPILKENYFLDKDWKPISYQKYIMEKVKNTVFRGEGN